MFSRAAAGDVSAAQREIGPSPLGIITLHADGPEAVW